jgi:hypothetical protein
MLPRKRGRWIDTKDTSHRLLQTDYLERAPIGSVTCPCRLFTPRVSDTLPTSSCLSQLALESAPFGQPSLRGTPGGPKPVEIPSCRSAFDDARRALVTALSTFPLPFGRTGTAWIGDRGAYRRSRPVVGRFGELSRATLVSALHPSMLARELLRLSPSDSGQSPLTPSSPGRRLSAFPSQG